MSLSNKISKNNFKAFLWHAGFLAFAQNFMDVDTVIPAMIVEAGGKAMHIGIMTAIMMGGSSFSQILFAPFVSSKEFKKKYLLIGINLRVFSLLSLAIILFWISRNNTSHFLWLIFLFISIFSFSGAFTNISYVDLLGKSINKDKRKSFFSTRQIIGGVIVLSTAFLAKKILSIQDFPLNYSSMFFIGGISLLIATAGFWKLKETLPSGIKNSEKNSFLQKMSDEIKNNRKLIYFLGFINTQGIVISFIPFVILYAKETFQTHGSDTGVFLIFKVIGVVSIGLLVLFLNKRLRYNILMYSNIIISVLLALLIFIIDDANTLRFVFILGGIAVSLYSISVNGVLLEISGNENRALYTGFVGAGNILPTIFPLIAGGIISQLGYNVFFLIFIIIISSSAYFIYKIQCNK